MNVDQTRRSGRTNAGWYAASAFVLGLATFAFLAFVGLFPDLVRWPSLTLLIMVPIVVVSWLGRIRHDHPAGLDERGLRTERLLTTVYVLLLASAVALDLWLIPRGSAWSVVVALLPALPCWYAAWWVPRR